MRTIILATIERTYSNNGQHFEQALAYTLTGELRKQDHVPYFEGSDIPEYAMSVKSSKFSLMSGNLCKAQNFEGIVNEFFTKTASKCFAYVTAEEVAYIMNAEEFRQFVNQFCGLSRESTKNGGRYKVQMRTESRKVLEWLARAV